MFTCTSNLARKFDSASADMHTHRCRLLVPDSYILLALGRMLQFELAVGLNGRVWVRTAKPRHTVLIVNAIVTSEHMDTRLIDTMVAALSQECA
jgi:exosome complex component RRP40